MKLLLTQENFLDFTYFLFSLYSAVLNTFFFGAAVVLAAGGFSIFMAVPSTLGSNWGLMSVSVPLSTLGWLGMFCTY